MTPVFWNYVLKYFGIIFIILDISSIYNSDIYNYVFANGNLFQWNRPATGAVTPTADSNCAINRIPPKINVWMLTVFSQRLLNLLNVVCSTAQAVNTTARDGCYGCFIRYTPLPQGQQQLIGLSSCATMYFNNTPYSGCSARISLVASNVAVLPPTNGQCVPAFCEFVRCLRRANANSVIAQCAREVRALAPVNVTLDNDNIRYYTNMTSCILAKTRCNTYNPITGELQLPGVTQVAGGGPQSAIPLYNTLQTATDGSLRIISFPSTVGVTTSYCSSDTRLTQANWLNNECP